MDEKIAILNQMIENYNSSDEDDIYRVLEKRQDFDDRLINKELEEK